MEYEEIDVPVAHGMWEAGDVFVDVRTEDEYANGHIAGAINIPLSRLRFGADALPGGQVVAVCTSGNRSRVGAEALAQHGRTAFSLFGGTKAWKQAGLPIVTGTEPGARKPAGRLARLLARWRR